MNYFNTDRREIKAAAQDFTKNPALTRTDIFYLPKPDIINDDDFLDFDFLEDVEPPPRLTIKKQEPTATYKRARLLLNSIGFNSGEGVALKSATDYKIVWAINNLLNKKSDTTDQTCKDYFTGNETPIREVLPEARRISSDGNQWHGAQYTYPVLKFTPYEFAKEFTGYKKVSARDITTAFRALQDLARRNFDITFTQTEGEKRFQISTVAPLFQILAVKDITAQDADLSALPDSVMLKLLPLFREQIQNHYALYPNNFLNDISRAYGSRKVPAYVFALVDILQIQASYGKRSQFYYSDTLRQKINPTSFEKGKKSRGLQELATAVEVCRKLGIIAKFVQEDRPNGIGYHFFFTKNEVRNEA